jgi:hypothetical protein
MPVADYTVRRRSDKPWPYVKLRSRAGRVERSLGTSDKLKAGETSGSDLTFAIRLAGNS